MNDIARHDPFGELTHVSPLFFDPFMDDIFSRLTVPPFGSPEPKIRMDVKEGDAHYQISAEIPGVNKDDIRVSIDGKRVSISAEVRREEKEGERVISSERRYGRISRNLSLGCEVDQATVKAGYINGVLELTLPKKPGSARVEIPIT